MRSAALSNPLLSGSGLNRYRMVLVSFVQGVVRSFDKNLAPLIETRGQKAGEHTDDYLLNKRRVHPALGAAAMPGRHWSTKIPTVGSA